MFLKDPIDAWGKQTDVSLAELAVRNHAVAMPFDRRGDVIYWDDFENPSLKYFPAVKPASAGTINRSTTNPMFGDFCTKMVTGAVADDYCCINYAISNFHEGKIGVQIGFATQSTDATVYVTAIYYDGTNYHQGQLKYEMTNGHLSYYGDDSAWYVIDTIEFFTGYASEIIPYNTMKLVFDLDNGKYVRSLFFGQENDLSAYDLKSSASAIDRGLIVWWYLSTPVGTAQTAYFDNFILTENEPA